MQKTRLRKYAKLIARMGVNPKKGQDVVVNAGLDQPEFVAMVVEELYKLGARKVHVKWNYQPLQKHHVKYQSIETLGGVDSHEEAELQFAAEHHPARVSIGSPDPDGLKGVDVAKMSKGQQMKFPVMKKYMDSMDGAAQWSVAAVPGKAWAKKMFPNERTSTAMEKLWEAILTTARVDDDPIAAWEAHNADIQGRCEYLNGLDLVELEYHAGNGTDFKVGLIDGARFCGAVESTKDGVLFNPNIPTEECFVTPKKGVAEGIVYSTLPLSYQGALIENFWLRFENGKVVEAHAEKNDERLQKMITMDEGASYLGECALVPFDSPINQTGLLFYNTLFDENAVCHFALGRGYSESVPDHHNKTREEIKEAGVNQSMIHVDFMIGTADLSVVGHCRDGSTVQIFKDGNWAF
ncbi:MAG: aminopeptidase [Eubacteriales bacterium]|nr:aminopeptidase [Eubacteriales bacterium]